MHQQIRLLRPFQLAAPLIRPHRGPTHLRQIAKPTTELGVALGGVPKGKRPGNLFAVGPSHDRVQVGFQMHDRGLPGRVRETRMVATRYHVEHH